MGFSAESPSWESILIGKVGVTPTDQLLTAGSRLLLGDVQQSWPDISASFSFSFLICT